MNLDFVQPSYLTIIHGVRATGKTTVAYHLYQQIKHHYNRVVVFSQTKLDGFWTGVVGEENVYEHPTPELLEAIRRYQMENRQSGEYLLIICDQGVDSNKALKRGWDNLCFNGRGLRIGMIVATQFIRAMPPAFRENCDVFLTLGRYTDEREKEAIHAHYFGHMSLDDFQRMHDTRVGRHQYLGVNVRNPEGLERANCVFTGQAPSRPLI
jgi:hypothetical protein